MVCVRERGVGERREIIPLDAHSAVCAYQVGRTMKTGASTHFDIVRVGLEIRQRSDDESWREKRITARMKPLLFCTGGIETFNDQASVV